MQKLDLLTRRCLFSIVLLATLFALMPAGLSAAEGDGSGLQQELLTDLGQLEQKVVDLAKAIPEEKYSWAPGEGVRTVSQALMHTATANFFFSTMLDVAAPEGVDLRGLEKITDKGEAIKLLESSFANLRQAIEGSADLSADKSYFGQDGTVGGLLHSALAHNHEHLGQMIAYARSNGVKPPWS